jgi:hypothetical protein
MHCPKILQSKFVFSYEFLQKCAKFGTIGVQSFLKNKTSKCDTQDYFVKLRDPLILLSGIFTLTKLCIYPWASHIFLTMLQGVGTKERPPHKPRKQI